MSVSTFRRSAVTAALLGSALLCGATAHATAATADKGDVQVNLDVLDQLGPTGGTAYDTGQIHLRPPPSKIKPNHTVAAAPPRAPAAASAATVTAPAPATTANAAAPAATVAAAAPDHETPSHAAAETAAAPASSASDSPPAAAPPPPPPAPADATATAMNTPLAAAKSAAPAVLTAAAPATPPPAPTRVLFAAGAVDLPAIAKPKLDALADWLDANQQARIQVVAYAAGSTEQANDARRTSLTRALAVRKYLADRGINTTRMEVRALGNHSAAGDPPDRVDIAMMDR